MNSDARKYTIIKNQPIDIERKKIKTAMVAATCIIDAAFALHFSNADTYNVIRKDLEMIYSSNILAEKIDNLDLIINILNTSANLFVIRNFKNSDSYVNSQKQFEEMNETDMKEVVDYE